jgi:hypothetical protein
MRGRGSACIDSNTRCRRRRRRQRCRIRDAILLLRRSSNPGRAAAATCNHLAPKQRHHTPKQPNRRFPKPSFEILTYWACWARQQCSTCARETSKLPDQHLTAAIRLNVATCKCNQGNKTSVARMAVGIMNQIRNESIKGVNVLTQRTFGLGQLGRLCICMMRSERATMVGALGHAGVNGVDRRARVR